MVKIEKIVEKQVDDIFENLQYRTCTKCGIVKVLNEENFRRETRRKTGYRAECKECTNEYLRNYRKQNEVVFKEKKRSEYRINNGTYKLYRQSKRGKYNNYKTNAKTRNYQFYLTFEEFLTFWNCDCFYCGVQIEGVGIDRLNNEPYYSLDVCVPCCATCNKLKMDLPYNVFIEKCKLIVENLKPQRI